MRTRSWIRTLFARPPGQRTLRRAPHRVRLGLEALEDRCVPSIVVNNNSTVTVQKSTVNGNKANGTVLGKGGGIYSSNSLLTLLASNVNGNKATTAFDDIFNGP